ncbi:hypothetical protein GCM10009717_17610 [Agromyces allii]|uniref:Uncharacterized protein n=1 Tax=Agromyces allii TaxID=393607 RepID=A0ABP5BT05_9MICO
MLGERRSGLGSDVEAEAGRPEGGLLDRIGRGDHVLGFARERRRDDDIRRQHDRDAAFGGLGEVALDGLDLVGFEQARADLVALGRQEGEEHAAADEQRVDPREQVRDDAELVGDLRAAEHDRVRALGVLGQAVEHVELGGDEQAGGTRTELFELEDARLLAVHDAEAVGDDGIGEARELLGERRALRDVLRGLARIEAEVLEHEDLAVGEGLDLGRGIRADRVGREGDGHVDEFAEAGGDRREAVLRVGCAFGATEVGDHDDARPLVGQRGECRKRRADTTVVRDDPVLERNVEVTTDDDARTGERTEAFDRSQGHDVSLQRRSATYSVRSTRRLE